MCNNFYNIDFLGIRKYISSAFILRQSKTVHLKDYFEVCSTSKYVDEDTQFRFINTCRIYPFYFIIFHKDGKE